MNRIFPAVALALTLFSGNADAKNWVAVREPSPPDKPLLPAIYVDADSIKILPSGLRRATSKVDWFEQRQARGEIFDARTLIFMVWTNTYDCATKFSRENLGESHMGNGNVHQIDRPDIWYRAPSRAADPSFYYVCEWNPRRQDAGSPSPYPHRESSGEK
jgi:hypothetical protein